MANPDIESDIQDGLNQLRSVGPEKPVSYLPVSTLITYFRSSIVEWVLFAEEHHLQTLLVPTDGKGGNHFFYLYDSVALQALLNRNITILQNAGWPSDPEEFIKRMSIDYAPIGTELFDLIADAFGDKDNPCRSDRQ